MRRFEDFDAVVHELEELVSQLDGMPLIDSPEGIGRAYALRDTLITQFVYLSAMRDYVALGGTSRGSALYVASADEIEKEKAEPSAVSSMVLETVYEDGSCRSALRQARDLPEGGGMFETVWREYRQHKNVY